MKRVSFVSKILALFVISALVVSSAFLVLPSFLSVASTSSSGPTIGILFPPPSTFFQSSTEEYIGNTATDIPYLAVARMSIGGVVVPGICQVPVPVANTNDTEWDVNLVSPNLKWSDGVAINSSDLAYSFGLFMTSGPYANTSTIDRWGADRGTFTNIAIMNSTEIQITTASPDPLFPQLTFLYVIYPYHYYKTLGFGNNVLQTTPVLAGPGDSAYVPSGYTAGSYTMTLNANPNSPSWNGATPSFSSITLQFFTSDSSLVSSLAGNTVDAGLITPSDVASLASDSSVAITQIPSDYQLLIYLHSTGYPWNNTDFRQAMMYLVNKTQINDALYNGSTIIGNPAVLIPQAMSTYWPGSSTPFYNYSVTTADSLLTAAGLTNSAGKWMLPNGTALTVTVTAPNNDPNYVRASQYIEGTLQSAGINVNLVDAAYSTVDTAWTSNNFQFLIFPNNYAPSPFRWMRNPFNLPGWTNSTFKSEFQSALTSINPTTALSDVKQAELTMAQAAVINSIVVLPQYVAYNKASYSNWTPALSNAPSYSVFWYPVSAENVLTAVTSVSTTSAVTSVSTTSAVTSVPPSSSNSLYVYVAIGIVVIVIVAVLAVFFMRRRPAPT